MVFIFMPIVAAVCLMLVLEVTPIFFPDYINTTIDTKHLRYVIPMVHNHTNTVNMPINKYYSYIMQFLNGPIGIRETIFDYEVFF